MLRPRAVATGGPLMIADVEAFAGIAADAH